MDVRKKFLGAAAKMYVDFQGTYEANHKGGRGTNREDLLRGFLEQVLPWRYSLGKGEVVASTNHHSGELDVVIFDGAVCPRLLVEDSHALFPLEAVYGAVQVKTTLTSSELEASYGNIASLKSLAPQTMFRKDHMPGFSRGYHWPLPVGVVFAYEGGRTLDTIAKQVAKLDEAATAIAHRPDFIVVINEGIIGPKKSIRDQENRAVYRTGHLSDVQRSGKHTLMRFYLRLLQELNSITLPPFDLSKYLSMPELVGGHRVYGHDGFLWRPSDGAAPESVHKLSKDTIERIAGEKEGPVSQHQLMAMAYDAPTGRGSVIIV